MKQTSLVSSLSRTPSSAVKRFLWRRQIWFESTFALSMLEPWEKMLIVGVMLFVSSLCITSAIRYLPNHVSIMVTRACFYLTGSSNSTLPIEL
ncbi:hypothetical protein ACGC1H_004517 [Rhizoctonia solani]